jgi:hypothetical protein
MAQVTVETFATLAESTITADPGSAGVSLALANRSPFPQLATGQFRLIVQNSENDKTNREVMLVTAGQGAGAGSFTVVRGQEGTAGVAHAAGSYVALVYTAAASYRFLPDYAPQPRHFGFLGWTYPVGPSAGATTPVMVTLVPWLFKIYVPETMTFTNMHAHVVTAGGTLTAGSNLGALYLSTGVRIGTTATQATTWTTTGMKTMALTVDGGQSLTVAGGPDVFVWAALLGSGTTVPTFSRWSTTIPGWVNGNLAAAQSYVGKLAAVTGGSGPPTSFTPSTITQEATPHWVGLS